MEDCADETMKNDPMKSDQTTCEEDFGCMPKGSNHEADENDEELTEEESVPSKTAWRPK